MTALKNYIHEVSVLLGQSRAQVYRLLILFLFSSFLDILGIGLIAPYVTLVINPESEIAEGVMGLITRFSLVIPDNNPIQRLGLIILTVFIFKAVFAILINRSILKFCFHQGANLRADLLSTYQKAPYLSFLKRNSSEYIHNINLAASFSQDILQSILRLLSVGIVGLVIIVFLAIQDVLVLLLLLSMLAFVAVGFDKLFKKNLRTYGENVNIESRRLVQSTNEAIQGFKEIRVLGGEKYFHRKLEQSAWGYAENSIRLALIATAPRYLLEVAVMAFVISVVALFSVGSGVDKNLVPTLSMFGVAALRLFPFANQTVTSVTKLRAGRHTVSLLYRDLSVERDCGVTDVAQHTNERTSRDQFRSFELRDVSFQYPSGKKKILDKISFQINAGESIGIIGDSGAGKTTLMDIVLGLLPPQQGALILNDQVISKNLREWQKMVAYLPQDVFLVDGSVRENVALGQDLDTQEPKMVEKAIEQSQLDETIVGMSAGLETSVGEDGIRISGGQKQRIALARAFYHDRRVLVLDESTSALDAETEAEVMREIRQLKGRTTTLIIAHRLTTLSSCTRIYRLSHGRLQEVDYEAEVARSAIKAKEILRG